MNVINPRKQKYYQLLPSKVWSNTKLAKALGTTKVTVLICTLNEVDNLPYVLPKIPLYVGEVIIVNRHSTDGTPEVTKNFDQMPKYSSRREKEKGTL